jgi:hypothetical protein
MFLPVCWYLVYMGVGIFQHTAVGGSLGSLLAPVNGVLSLAWGIAGFAGLIGYWLWLLGQRWINSLRFNFIVSVLLLCGVLAIFPVVVETWRPPIFAAILPIYSLAGLISGVVLICFSCHAAWVAYSLQRTGGSRVVET